MLESYNPMTGEIVKCTQPTDLCSLDYSLWPYQSLLRANLVFLVLFAISTVAYLVQGLIGKKWMGFTIAMASGCTLEVIGYAGRVMGYYDVFDENPFLIQIICLTIAPAFLVAGIYFCLSRIVTAIGPQYSRIKPLSYPRIFIPCDFISLVLQAAGGGISSVATHNHEKTDTGDNIMIAGLAFQVATMILFILLSMDFAWNTLRHKRTTGYTEPTQVHNKSWKFKAFLVALSVSTSCIFARCVFRVTELSQGWTGHLAVTEKYFIGLEGAIIIAAVLLLNIFHPGHCFKGAVDERTVQPSGKKWWGKKSDSIVDAEKERAQVSGAGENRA